MANKFTKSVLERQEKERKQTTTATKMQDTAGALAPLALDVAEQAAHELPTYQEPEIVQEPVEAKTAREGKGTKSVPDLGAYIIREEGRCAKNKTFYLDAAVIDGLKRAAVAQKVTESKLVNDILKRLLNI